MYLSIKKKFDKLYETPDRRYYVISNTRKEMYEDIEELGEEHLPNYLIVNTGTGAIEFAVDQLPAAYQVANKLESETNQILSGSVVDGSVEGTRVQ